MTRLLDRYVWSTFLAALGVFMLAFLALYVVVDLATKLTRFLEPRSISAVELILRYYLVRIPVLLNYLLPSVVLFAAIFTIIRLSRNNELLPMVASGTSLRRVSVPFLVTAVASSLAMAAMDEWILPGLATEIADTDDIVSSREKSYEIWMYGTDEASRVRTLVLARVYDPVTREMSSVKIEQMDGESRVFLVVFASTCRWDEAREKWVARAGTMEWPLEKLVPQENGRPMPKQASIPPEGWAIPAPFTPQDVWESSSFLNRIPFARLADLLEEARAYPHHPSFQVKIHLRFAFPLSPVVLLLLGLPFVGGLLSPGFLKGLFFCFLLAVGYYVAYFAFVEFGIKGKIDPVLAGWVPTATFGLIGLLAFARIRT